jgi:amidophosphoribosyltransferase
MDGITGIYGPGDAELVQKAFLATGALQHRGKTGAGIAVGGARGIHVVKGVGGIGDVVDADMIHLFQELSPTAAIGNVGYTKNKVAEKRNAEPVMVRPRKGSAWQVALTVNGRLVEDDDLQAELEGEYAFETSNKAEVLGALLHRCIAREGATFAAGRALVDLLHGRGSFALTALAYDGRETRLIALNDSRAFEPFCFGTVDGRFVASSESCSHRRLGGFAEREYLGAEMTVASSAGVETRRLREETPLPDVFQAIYFGNVASQYRGEDIFQLRKRLGVALTRLYGKPEVDVVIANPDSGRGVSYGIAEGLGMPISHGLVKQAQAIRTFQESQVRKRTIEVGLKFAAIDSVLRDKRVVMGDDSIVKGSVSEGGSVWSAYNAGAKRLEFWISYGPMFFPSFKEWRRGRECLDELAVQRAFRGEHPYDKPLDEIDRRVAKLIGVDRVCYNTRENVEAVTGPGSFQAMDASYPVAERYWPDWLKAEVERSAKLGLRFG